MRNKFTLAAIAMAAPGLLIGAVPASAAPTFDKAPTAQASTVLHSDVWEHGRYNKHKHKSYRNDNYGRGGYNSYNSRQSYYGDPVSYRTRAWRGDDGRYYCKKENGTTGLLIGGAAGALVGNQVAGSGNRTLGALLGAAGGALLGRAIDLSNSRCR